ncbi:NADPH dehydrogenase [Chaetomium fimeti]|uniref:NADPH dehydrogenase n=1 Tax=Chaetomium fimeti TaxID=1854472 RepID=A0AAE0HIN2_9PEZI|nr:NADPH dehydrogenase [Chaetomium fimeti]
MGGQFDLQIAQPLTLKCGLTLPNRLVKAAMAEQLAGTNQLPDERLLTLYKHWAQGGWGLIITGHVHVDDAHLGAPADSAIPPSLPPTTLLPAYSALARASQGDTHTPTIGQLNHPGRQSPRGTGRRGFFAPAVAPSAVPVSLGSGWVATAVRMLGFGTPRALTVDEIGDVVAQFARAARVCAEAGFEGVEVHAAHGYLLSQFLSGRSNVRGDGYGGDARARARVVVEVVRAVRKAVEGFEGFCVGVKLNSADHQNEGEMRDCVEQVRAIVEAGVDFVEVSGGSFENPKMIWGNDGPDGPEEKSDRTKAREAFFLEFAHVIRKEFPDVPLMVTGGFSSRGGMEKAVVDGDCDLIGLGRPAVLNPSTPNSVMFNAEVKDQDATLYRKKNKTPWFFKWIGLPIVGAGMDSQYYTERIHELSKA